MLLDIGVRRTTEGFIISWQHGSFRRSPPFQSRGRPITVTYYRLLVNFATPNGRISVTNCILPNELIMGERASDVFARPMLRQVTVEYVPWNPSFARAEGTRLSLVSFDWSFSLFLALIVLSFATNKYFHRKKLRVLKEGYFTTGRVLEIRMVLLWDKLPPMSYYAVIVVSFTDQYGAERTGRKKISKFTYLELQAREWSEGLFVGLLYLHGQEDIAITDMLVYGYGE